MQLGEKEDLLSLVSDVGGISPTNVVADCGNESQSFGDVVATTDNFSAVLFTQAL